MTAMATRALSIAAGLTLLVGLVAASAWWWRARDGASPTPIGADSIVLLGDSITYGGDWDALLPGLPVVNRGHPGYTTQHLLAVAADVAEQSPLVVVVMTGTNDIRDGRPPSWTAERLGRMIDTFQARSPDTTVIVQSVLPRAAKAAEIVATNAEIRDLVRTREVRFLDLHPIFDDGSGGLRVDETTDGWHLSAAGYRRWAAALEPVLAGLDN